MNRGSERRKFSVLAASAALALFAVSAASAQEEGARDDNKRAATRAIVAEAPNARLAALIDAGGAIIRQKGVANVVRISEGQYCIRPTAASGVNPRTAIVIVTEEFFFSWLDEIEAQWASRGHDCGPNRIAVRTKDDRDLNGSYNNSNLVGFTVFVP